MRLWSLHPRYLDTRGLVALWREGLLARKVLRGETKGYRHHPQLSRFRNHAEPLAAIDRYLGVVCDEADRRGYHFDRTKIAQQNPAPQGMTVTNSQLRYEWQHLLGKLQTRNPEHFANQSQLGQPEAHPLFRIIDGPVEPWEVISTN